MSTTTKAATYPVSVATIASRMDEDHMHLGSVDDIATWLKAQPGVESVLLRDYWIKTDPPKREFVMTLRTADGGHTIHSIFVDVLPDGRVLRTTMQQDDGRDQNGLGIR